MKKGDYIRFISHAKGNRELNESMGLFIGGVYEVQDIDKRDGSPLVKTEIQEYVPTFPEEVELIIKDVWKI